MNWLRKSAHPGEISISERPELTDDYVELARFWISPTSFRSNVLVSRQTEWGPELLGSLMEECLRSAALTYASSGSMSEEEALTRLRKGFDEHRREMGKPTMKDAD